MQIKLLHKLQQTIVDVEPFLSVRDLKVQAAEWSGIPMNLLKLLFRGRACPDDETVEGTGMKEGAKVHVIRSISATNEGSSSAEAPNVPSKNAAVTVLTKVEQEVNDIESQVILLKKGEEGQELNQRPKPIVLNELLTQKLLYLDNLDVTGEDRVRRKTLINRIHDLCSQLDKVDKTES